MRLFLVLLNLNTNPTTPDSTAQGATAPQSMSLDATLPDSMAL